MRVEGKKVCVVGFGKSGQAAVRLLREAGAKVFVTEKEGEESFTSHLLEQFKDVEFEFGTHSTKALKDCSLLVLSPGVDPQIPLIQEAKNRGIGIISELELGYRFLKVPFIIAITGTNGKSTTASLLHHILRRGGKRVLCCGNIGTPLCAVVGVENIETLILEVSSFQLEFVEEFLPNVAVLLNIAPDHLERHKSLKDYARVKMKIFKNQGVEEFSVVNKRDPMIKEMLPQLKTKLFCIGEETEQCCFMKGERVYLKSEEEMQTASLEGISLYLKQNSENLLSAICVARIMGMELEKIVEEAKSFEGLEHRMEYVDSILGVPFVNDSKATNPHATLSALSATAGSVILICGGRMKKGASLCELKEIVKEKVKAMIVMGEAKKLFKEEFAESVDLYLADGMDEAVFLAYEKACTKDCILLSPACSSHDMFTDFEQRGKAFKAAVRRLKERVCAKALM